MMRQAGGGLITNGRTQEPTQSIPNAPPMKPAAQQAPPPQAPPQQAGPPMQGQGAPMGQAPMGQPGMQQPGMGGGQDPAMGGGQDGVNHIASNALRILHDPSTAPQIEQMIAQGDEGAAEAVVTIGDMVIQGYQQQGQEIDPEQASEAIIEVMQDVGSIGINQGYMAPEPLIDGQPASVMAMMSYAMDKWTERYPEFGQEMASGIQDSTPEEQASAQQLGQYMQQGGVNNGPR